MERRKYYVVERMYFLTVWLILSGVLIPIMAQTGEIPYKNDKLSINTRATDLLSRMTLEEKAAQMVAVNNEVKDSIIIRDDGTFDISKIKPLLVNGVGQITRLSETKGGQSQTSGGESNAKGLSPYQNAMLSNAVQRFFIEETRLGIPAIFHEECLHGLVAQDATSFPHPIAMAGTFDNTLLEKVYAAIAEETRVRGAHQALTPVVDIARDARWGRIEETFGEDPFLTAQMGISAIKGFQGDGTFQNKKHIIATLKHFAGHGQPEGGTNTAPANYSQRILNEVHFYPFKEIIKEANPLSIMTTYHELDGIPINAHKKMITDVLRKQWGFKGFVVSDYYSIREMHERFGVNTHRVAKDGKHAAELALRAGVNIELPNPDCYSYIPELVKEGKIPESIIDTLVVEMLRQKFRLGLFDDPYLDANKTKGMDGFAQNRRELAKVTAQKSITLLKNQNKVAPIAMEKVRSIAVIGPNANREMVGGYTGNQPYHITVLEGIREKAGKSVEVNYAEGCQITKGGSWVEDEVVYPSVEEDAKMIAEAVEIAKKSDVIVLVVGGNEQTSREAWNNFHLGDRADLQLVGSQDELINALHETGKPIFAFVYSGRPLAFTNLIEKAEAIFQCWYLGQESGSAVADVLFGDYNPGGKLPISFPRSVGHIPVYYNHKPSARRGYLGSSIKPLYPFGFGLSYTSFEIGEPKLEKPEILKDQSVQVSVQVKNTGASRGDEVIQMYISDDFSSVTRPVRELKGFKRITLEPGETKTVRFNITPEKLSFYDINMDYTAEPGSFTIWVGNSSAEADLKKTTLSLK